LYDLFDSNTNALVKPSSWDDPFENLILKSKIKRPNGDIVEYGFHNNFYGQCWTLHKASDAMWRIYSQDKMGVRIRTTIRKLLTSLNRTTPRLADLQCYIGKVRYLSTNDLLSFGDQIYDEYGVANENLFRSLLIKRKAFSHEKEIRLLYQSISNENKDPLFRYKLNPHEVIDQLMLDPRLTADEANSFRAKIKDRINFTGKIKRSLLYAVPDKIVVKVKT
jgi:hypothetical protein